MGLPDVVGSKFLSEYIRNTLDYLYMKEENGELEKE